MSVSDRLKRYRSTFFEDWYQFNGVMFFILICLFYVALLLLNRIFIIADIAAFDVLQQRGEMFIFDLFFGLQYLSVPFFLGWKFSLTAFSLWVGCFMFGYRITYAQLWRWVMFSEILFLLPEIIKFLWFLMFAGDPDYHEVVAFYPLALINFVDHGSIASRYHYPLQVLNLFELGYWAALVIGVFYLSGKKLAVSTYAVLSSYVFLFLVWLVFYILVYG